MVRYYIHEYLTPSDSEGLNLMNIMPIPSITYGIFKMVKLGNKRWKAKWWLKLWLKIPKRILLTRFNINCITNKQLEMINNQITS
jgi:hypothetical protein